jgi:phospholipid/cholesterol/gamma-HCH transport system substrate-binding protein
MRARGPKSKFVEIRVGLFVAACIGIFVLAIVYISSGSGIFGPTFQAVTYLPTVGGLKAGAPVQLAGVEVGTVVRVDVLAPELEPKNQTNLQVYSQLRETREEITERRKKIPELDEELKPLIEKKQKMLENKKGESAEYKALTNKIEDIQLAIETHNNKIGDLTGRIEVLQQTIQNVQVIMKIEQTYKNWLRKDSSVGVGSIGLLGDKYIDISLGRSDQPPEVNEQKLVVITGKKETDFREIITGIDDLVGNFGVLSQRFRNLTSKMEEGTVAQFIGDRSFYDNLNYTIKEAEHTLKASTELLQEIKTGKGTVGRLISEDKLYKEINTTTARANEIMGKINSAQGVLGKLINEDALYKKADSMIDSADIIAARIKNGQGTLGKLSQDEALYVQTRDTMQKLSKIMDDIEKGNGTMGKLIKDKSLYENLNQTSAELVKLLYDFRQDPKKYLTIRFRLF